MVAGRSIKWILIVCLFLASCRSFASEAPTPDSVIEATQPADTATPVPDYVNELRNSEYQLGASNTPRTVQLKDGRFEEGVAGSTDYVSVAVTDLVAAGDLNSDGVGEVAALISENYGGSGVFVFLAVYTEEGGKLLFQSSILVDDRPQLNKLSIADGQIFLDATIHGSNDPMCCPTLRSTRHYMLANNQLDMTDYVTYTTDGRPRTITIESPADGMQVFNSVQFKGEVAISPFENSLTYRIYDLGGVELAIGSIPVSADGTGGTGTFDNAISLGNILSGAVIRIELQDINADDGSLYAMDSVQLVVQ